MSTGSSFTFVRLMVTVISSSTAVLLSPAASLPSCTCTVTLKLLLLAFSKLKVWTLPVDLVFIWPFESTSNLPASVPAQRVGQRVRVAVCGGSHAPDDVHAQAELFSGNVRMAVIRALNVGSELLAPMGPLETLVAVLPEPCPSV